ncbi:MAG: GNAT family N-acetyltransferase [Chloroflexi bacterium]|nr:GNAT family N-acetyltransferase [Chloroflexota bacterium]
MKILPLHAEDAQSVHALRLRSLREHPEAFGSAYEDEVKFPIERVVERLQTSADKISLGAWIDEELVGFVSFNRYPGRKTRHRASLGAMYVKPEARGQGVGAALLNEVIHHARALVDLEEVTLAVTVGNETAHRLYQAVGFVDSHVEKRYIKLDDRYYDIQWMTLRL